MIKDSLNNLDIQTLKNKFFKEYMQIAHNYMSSRMYSYGRSKAFSNIILCAIILVLIAFLYLITNVYDSPNRESAEYIGKTIGIFAILSFPFAIFCMLQSDSFISGIKKDCAKSILEKLANIQYTGERLLSKEDITSLNLASPNCLLEEQDCCTGSINGLDYTFEEIKLERKGTNQQNTIEFSSGVVLKINKNTNINSPIEIRTRKMFIKQCTIEEYVIIFAIMHAIILVIICIPLDILNIIPCHNNNVILVICILTTSFIVSSIIFAKIISLLKKRAKDKIQQILQNKLYRQNYNKEYIKNRVTIKTSNDIDSIDNIVTPEFVDLLDNLIILYNTSEILCKICNDKIYLAIDTRENLFEVGNLFVPPTNKNVAERFVSQITGIYLFLNYVEKLNNDIT